MARHSIAQLAAGVVLLASSPSGAAAADPSVRVLFQADIDGRLAIPACGGPSATRPDHAATVATIAAERDRDEAAGRAPPIVVLGGNFAAPDVFARSLIERGRPGISALAEVLSRARYDAVALGHHELALRPDELGELVTQMKARGVAVVATNLRCAAARSPLCAATRPDALVRRGGEVVGLVATIAPSVLAGVPGPHREGLSLEDPVAAIAASARRLQAQGATRIIVIAQGPRDSRAVDEMDGFARRLAGEPLVDVVLAGGVADPDGRALTSMQRAGAPPVVGSAGTADVVAVELTGRRQAQVALLPAAEHAADPVVAQLLRSEAADYCRSYGAVIAEIPAGRSLTRADLSLRVLETLRRLAETEIALINTSFVKSAAFPLRGALTRGDLFRALPYSATIASARVPGPLIEKTLAPLIDNPRAAIAGLARKSGKLEVNGRPLDKARSYTVATISFVTGGGDGLVAPGALRWRELRGLPDLRAAVVEAAGAAVDSGADPGARAAARALIVALTDFGLDLLDTSISNGPGYSDAQLVRTRQTSVKGDLAAVLALHLPRHELDGRLNVKYGWLRSRSPDGTTTTGETADLGSFSTTYNYKGFRTASAQAYVPDPYLRMRLEFELTRPAVTATQLRSYRHFELTPTAGALVTIASKLKLRAGAGARRELLADGASGRWRPLLEAGGTLDQLALATVGELAVRFEAVAEYVFVDPAGAREHQLRATGKLSVPLLPLLSLTTGLDVFAVQRQRLGWGASFDTTIGLRLHLDAAHQRL